MIRRLGPTGDPDPAADPAEPWAELVGKVGSGIAEPLTDALEQIHSLVHAGRVDQARLRQLRIALEEARQVGMNAQQLTRFATRRVRIAHEEVRLDAMLREVLQHRRREAEARGLALPDPYAADIRPVEVLVDASLLFSLLNTLFDWLLRHAAQAVALSIDMRSWPAHARLRCSFDVLDWPRSALDPVPPVFDSLSWRLLEQMAGTLDLQIERDSDGPAVRLALQFPRTAKAGMPDPRATDLDDPSTLAPPDSMPLVGSHVLIVASRRALRLQIRNAIHHMGLVIDLVSSIDEAAEFCRSGLPHAIVVEQLLDGERLSGLRRELLAEAPGLAFIAITEEGAQFEMSDERGSAFAQVRRSALETALPSVLLFELSRDH